MKKSASVFDGGRCFYARPELIPQRRIVIIIDAAVVLAVAPVPRLRLAILRRAFELLFGNAGDVTFEVRVVLQVGPGQRIVVLSDPHEAAKRQHGIGNLAAYLVDHHAFDLADLLAVGAVDGGTFDLVAADERDGFTFFSGGRGHVSILSISPSHTNEILAV